MRDRLRDLLGPIVVAALLAGAWLASSRAIPCCAHCYCWPSPEWCFVIICPIPWLVIGQ